VYAIFFQMFLTVEQRLVWLFISHWYFV